MAASDHSSTEFETRVPFWQAIWPSAARLPLTSALAGAITIAWVLSWAALVFVAFVSAVSLTGLAGARPFGIGVLAINDPNELSVWIVGGLSATGLLIVIFAYLRGIFRSLAAGDPFVPENAGRLRGIAATLAVLELMRILVATGASISESGTLRGAEVNFVVWIAVAILIVLAHIFAVGASLRADSKLTV